MSKLKVFVSSAIDELEYEREIATRTIADLNLEPSVFEGFPAMSKTLEDAYIDAVKNCDIFVLILWKSLRPAVEREYLEAVQDNKSILIFVKMLKEGEKREDRLDEFLGTIKSRGEEGINAANIRFYKHYRSLADLEEGLRDGIISEINRKLTRTIITTNTKEHMYELGTNIILSARKRVCITQQTPSLLLGCRPYHAGGGEKILYEVNFHDALCEWIDSTIGDKERRCMYIYDAQSTKAEMEEHGLQNRVKERIELFKEKERRSGHRIRISSAPFRYCGPLAVGDSWFAIWVMGGDNALSISYANEQVADTLADVFGQMVSKITTVDDLLKELGLS
jgi:bacterioferritin (cytochrome b1)